MRTVDIKDIKNKLNLEEKARIVTGVGSWHTYTANGKTDGIFMSDGPHGLRVQDMEEYSDINNSRPATAFPTGSCLASSWNPDCAAALGRSLANEAKKEKVDMVLGPAVNIQRSPLCGRDFEYYSEDPFLAGFMGTAYVDAMEKAGVRSCLKHFAANSQEKNRQTTDSIVDERTLREIYLKAFEMIIKKGHPSAVMGAYNKLNGEYCCRNHKLLTHILRSEWGYEGAVISDWGAVMDITECIRNGMDLEMPDSYGFHTALLLEDIKKGKLTERELDRAVENVLRLVYAKDKTEVEDKGFEEDIISRSEQTALKIAEESAVLMKYKGLLPVNKSENILILGPFALTPRFQGGGSSHITTDKKDNIIDKFTNSGFNVTYSADIPDDTEKFDKILYFCGLTDKLESEGYDRRNMDLPKDQLKTIDKLLSLGPKTVLVTFGGAPFSMPFYEKAYDILHMHLCGQEVAQAAFDLITGLTDPSGRLAQTWPLCIEDTPSYGNFSTQDMDVVYGEGLFNGYRYYETFNRPCLLEFGFGLSYTSFEYRDLEITEKDHAGSGNLLVSCNVKNTGKRDGYEVVQIYVKNDQAEPGKGKITNPDGSVIIMERPAVCLAGFKKIFLEAGCEAGVEIEISEDAFKIFDVSAGCFVTAGGDYDICAASSVHNIRLKDKISIRGGRISSSERVYMSWRNDKGGQPLNIDPENGSDCHDPEYINCLPDRYTIYDSMEKVCGASLLGKIVLGVVTIGLRISCKGGPEDPAYLMVVTGMRESPMDSLISTSNGLVKPNLTEGLVLLANKHPWQGLRRILSHQKG